MGDKNTGNIKLCFESPDPSIYIKWWNLIMHPWPNYTNPGYGLSLVDTLWNAGSYRQPLEQEGNPMT